MGKFVSGYIYYVLRNFTLSSESRENNNIKPAKPVPGLRIISTTQFIDKWQVHSSSSSKKKKLKKS